MKKRRPVGGPVWSDTSEDLNATVLVWDPGGGPPPHTNDERDVLVAVLDGSATVVVDDERHELAAGDVLIIPKGRCRSLSAGASGVTYVSAHRRRPALQIRPLSQAGRDERRAGEG